jgi:CheY-like chemotaxis protein
LSIEKWLNLLISLLQIISWPLIVLVILIYLRRPLKRFIENMVEITFTAGPVSTTAKRQQIIDAAVSLGAATATEKKATNGDNEANTQDAARLVNQLLTPQVTRRVAGKSILWVDDVPSNNTFQRNALEALGIHFTISASTDEALRELQAQRFDAIISDMGRPPDPRAGYTLLEKVRQMGITTPYIIYARGGNKPESKAEARSKGAFASVSGPPALFETVIYALESSQ